MLQFSSQSPATTFPCMSGRHPGWGAGRGHARSPGAPGSGSSGQLPSRLIASPEHFAGCSVYLDFLYGLSNWLRTCVSIGQFRTYRSRMWSCLVPGADLRTRDNFNLAEKWFLHLALNHFNDVARTPDWLADCCKTQQRPQINLPTFNIALRYVPSCLQWILMVMEWFLPNTFSRKKPGVTIRGQSQRHFS